MLAARRSRDLTAVAALALLGLALVLIPGGGWLEGVLLLPLVLILPGYALAAALFQPGSIPPAERAVYTVALSIAVTGLGSVLAQIAFDLDRGVWVAMLLAATLAACWVAQRRRELLPVEGASPRFELPSVNPLAIVAVLAAIGVAAGAFSIAVDSTRDSRAEAHFAELWVLPQRNTSGGSGGSSVSIGIGNHEGRPVTFRLQATRGGKVVASWTVRLTGNESWQTNLSAPRPSASAPLRVILLRNGLVYREAFLRSNLES
jgi:uncharacterized membrane protein